MITYFIIGAQVTLPIYIYTQIKFGITPAINAVATLLIVTSLGITALGLLIPRLVASAGPPRTQQACSEDSTRHAGCGEPSVRPGRAEIARQFNNERKGEILKMGRRLRVGVVGCGVIAQVMHLPHLRRAPR